MGIQLFTVFSAISVVMCIVPLAWHVPARSTGTCLYAFWTGITCLMFCINSIIWAEDALIHDSLFHWCRFSALLQTCMMVGLPCASLCINHRLYRISTDNVIHVSKADKRRAVVVDLLIGMGIPILQGLVHIVVQGNEFDIFERIGVWPITYTSWLAFVLSYTWPLIIGLISATFACLSIYAFYKHQDSFNTFLSVNAPNITRQQYWRLMLLAGTDLVMVISLNTTALYIHVVYDVMHRFDLQDTHWGFANIYQYVYAVWGRNSIQYVSSEAPRWGTVLCAFFFFAFFGFSEEARKHYRLAFNWVAKRVGSAGETDGIRTKSSDIVTIGERGTLPIYVRQHPTKLHDSFASFNKKFILPDMLDINSPSEPSTSSSSGGGTFRDTHSDASSSNASLHSSAGTDRNDSDHMVETSVSPAFPERAHGRDKDSVARHLSSTERFDVTFGQRVAQTYVSCVIPNASKSSIRRSL